MNLHDDSALRSLDAASAPLTADERERAGATLERIVAAAPKAVVRGAPQPTTAPAPARRARHRLILVSTAALALIAGSAVFRGVGGDNAAYASWTATPTSVTGADLDAATAACNKKLRRWVSDAWYIDPDKARIVLAERRGDHVALLYRREDPENSTSCLVRNPPGSSRVDDVQIGAGGSSGPAEKAPPRGFTQGAISGDAIGGDDGFSITDGAVGDEVTGVTIHADDLTVRASVRNGRYAAWWPGPAFEGGPPQPSGRGGPEPILTYDLTLADGTVIRDARPTLPS